MPPHPAALPEILQFLTRELLQGESVELKADTRLLDLGLINSISAVMLASFLEGKFGVKVPRQALTPENLETPRTIAAMVARLRPPA